MKRTETLQNTPLFRGLDADDLAAIDALVEPVKMVGGDTLYHDGSEADALYVLVLGTVEFFVGGRERPTMRLGSGQLVGALGLVIPEKRASSAVAVEVTHLLRIGLPELHRLLDDRPKLAAQIYRNLARFFGHHLAQMARELERPYF